jgi:hypothetical protein
MISDASFKIKRNKHASIHTLLAVLGSEGACISELADIINNRTNEKKDNYFNFNIYDKCCVCTNRQLQKCY